MMNNTIFIWIAIAILFVLFFTRRSGYINRKMDLMDLAETRYCSPELKNEYRKMVIQLSPEFWKVINDEWNKTDKNHVIKQANDWANKMISVKFNTNKETPTTKEAPPYYYNKEAQTTSNDMPIKAEVAGVSKYSFY